MPVIDAKVLECSQCGHKWLPTKDVEEVLPEQCARCKSRNWNAGKEQDVERKKNGRGAKTSGGMGKSPIARGSASGSVRVAEHTGSSKDGFGTPAPGVFAQPSRSGNSGGPVEARTPSKKRMSDSEFLALKPSERLRAQREERY